MDKKEIKKFLHNQIKHCGREMEYYDDGNHLKRIQYNAKIEAFQQVMKKLR